ncbi:MAG: hypothetical protein HY801_11830, partial [Candidatus Lindowbacteria bacterium]|nr:hypothetical protein [Candidatus Lindowbacteria bacterium]
MVDQLNDILADDSYWKYSARERASRVYDKRIVAAFYDDMKEKNMDPWETRNEVIHLPGPDEGYARILLVGATGGGKTTLLRQLLGSDSEKERFPSTSTAKTTIFDIEIVLNPGPFHVVVSFLSQEHVRSLIEECVTTAISAAVEGYDQDTVLRRLMEHSEQRFRLTYLLGTLSPIEPAGTLDDDALDLEDPSPQEIQFELATVDISDRTQMQERLIDFFQRVIQIAADLRQDVARQLDVDTAKLEAADHDSFLEIIEEKLLQPNESQYEEAQSLIDDILDEVESKFSFVEVGSYERERSGWPHRWTFESNDRKTFIKEVNRFSSNYAPSFGRLLGPLVQGMRVSGPFCPEWCSRNNGIPRFVFIDGEGLGHTPASASTVPTATTRRYDIADVILLIDNAAQPMQAAAQSVLQSVAASGHDSKLTVVFTHFEQVKGDNLPNAESRKNHVRASLENAISGVEGVLGCNADKRLRRFLQSRVFFVSSIDKTIPERARSTRADL